MRRLVGLIKCLFGHHEYYCVERFTDTHRQIACTRCNGVWMMSDYPQAVVKWGAHFEEAKREIEEVRG
jgi:hypothetical protein